VSTRDRRVDAVHPYRPLIADDDFEFEVMVVPDVDEVVFGRRGRLVRSSPQNVAQEFAGSLLQVLTSVAENEGTVADGR